MIVMQNNRTTPLADLIMALSRLSSSELLARLADLHIEEEQLRMLLRVARARERATRVMQTASKEATANV